MYCLKHALQDCPFCSEEEIKAEREKLNQIEYSLQRKSPDSNVEKNRELLLQRSKVGLKKYGCTTENLTVRESLQHALEESLDLANYLQQLIGKLDEQKEV
jgi:uncharacterized membrane protein YgaE (UPF0421/DUF939 family)